MGVKTVPTVAAQTTTPKGAAPAAPLSLADKINVKEAALDKIDAQLSKLPWTPAAKPERDKLSAEKTKLFSELEVLTRDPVASTPKPPPQAPQQKPQFPQDARFDGNQVLKAGWSAFKSVFGGGEPKAVPVESPGPKSKVDR